MTALITGVNGQDGGYLAEQLCAAGQAVTGLMLPGEPLAPHIEALRQQGQIHLLQCDLAEPSSLRQVLRDLAPGRVFHLAAVSEPGACEDDPVTSAAVNVTSVEVLAEWLRREQLEGRVLVASSAWVFGASSSATQSETTPAQPNTEYARQKQNVREIADHAREAGLYMSCAIPFSHESPRRSEQFVVAKVCNSLARIKLGQQEHLDLGPAGALRDWGYAPEFTQAYAWMLEMAQPLELVIATGEAHSVDELVQAACDQLELDRDAYVSTQTAEDNQPQVSQCGDPSRAWEELGWEAQTKFADLISLLLNTALSTYREQ